MYDPIAIKAIRLDMIRNTASRGVIIDEDFFDEEWAIVKLNKSQIATVESVKSLRWIPSFYDKSCKIVTMSNGIQYLVNTENKISL